VWRVGQALTLTYTLTYTLTFNVYRFIVTEMSGESIRCFTLAPNIISISDFLYLASNDFIDLTHPCLATLSITNAKTFFGCKIVSKSLGFRPIFA